MSLRMNDHTVKSFDEQLQNLSTLVAQMGGLAEAQFAAAIEAIARRDSQAGESAVAIAASSGEHCATRNPSTGRIAGRPGAHYRRGSGTGRTSAHQSCP